MPRVKKGNNPFKPIRLCERKYDNDDRTYMDDTFEEYFDEHVEDIVNDSPDSFTKEELKYVKREYLDEFD